jgi:hypothetical protein
VIIALALIALLAALLGLLTAVLGLVNQRRIKAAAALAEVTAGKVQQISVNVDGRLSGLFERQAQLLSALHDSGTPIPPFAEKRLIPSDPKTEA